MDGWMDGWMDGCAYIYIHNMCIQCVYIYMVYVWITIYIYYTRVLLVLLELFPQVQFQINRVVFVEQFDRF